MPKKHAISAILLGAALVLAGCSHTASVNINLRKNINIEVNEDLGTNANIQSVETPAASPSAEAMNNGTPAKDEDIKVNVNAGAEVKTQGTKEIVITAKQWEFIPSSITVNKGDKVRLIISSTDVTHSFSLPQFGVNQKLESGKTSTVEFTADKAGTFTFSCAVFCGEGHSGMKGTLTVK